MYDIYTKVFLISLGNFVIFHVYFCILVEKYKRLTDSNDQLNKSRIFSIPVHKLLYIFTSI